jgi:hypothetical protein
MSKEPEPLFTCPKCSRANFTARGLKAHVCKPKKSIPSIKSIPSTPKNTKPVTLNTLQKIPSGTEVPLADMNLDQLAASYGQLDKVEQSCTTLSGICATLKGLVLLESKRKCTHGKFQPWIKEQFPKGYRTAARYMRIAKEFSKSDTSVTFAALEADLTTSLAVLEQNKLDCANPIVRQVAAWTQGKSSYQLLLELGEGDRGGGAGDPGGAHVITYEQLTLRLHDACVTAAATLQGIHAQKAYYALNDAELDGFINHAEEVAAEAKRWRNLSKSERESIAQDQLAKLLK